MKKMWSRLRAAKHRLEQGEPALFLAMNAWWKHHGRR